jgi:hypothetical protein
MAIVYQHFRTDIDEVFYVGIGRSIKRAYSKNQRSKPWRDLIKDHSYRVEIVAEGLTWEQACEKERELIKYYGRRDLKLGSLVNMTDGGDGVENLPAETLRLIGSKLKGRVGTFRGKKHTEEAKRKNRDAHLGRKYSKESNLKKIHYGSSNGMSKQVYDPITGRAFPTITAAAQYFGIAQSTVRSRVKKKLLIIKKK